MTPTPAVSIIIPVWNLWDMTCDCLHSLAQHTDHSNIEIIVVDNGSTDESATALEPTGQALFGPHFRRIRHEENRGFAKACNAGAQAARAPRLLFLNNDTLLSPEWLPPLVDSLDTSPCLGMVGPLLLLPSGRVQHCGIAFAPTLEVSHIYDLFPHQHPLITKNRPLQAITGAAFLLTQELFFRCGQLHEGYINGFEDLDLCCLVRQQNLRLACVPRSIVYHLTSQTPGRSDHDSANARLLNQRQSGAFKPDLHLLGAEDGYIPRLSPSLELYLTLPAQLEAALTSTFRQHFNEERCRVRLEAEPLWEHGYTLLARHLESRKAYADAVNVRSTQVHFFPLAPYAVALARSAARSGEHALAQSASEATQSLLQSAANTEELQRKAQKLQAWSQEMGDTDLEKIFANWLLAPVAPTLA
ncbi:MAG: glycosyltransferase family 2 protein [Desulfovibrionaceae bacterium]